MQELANLINKQQRKSAIETHTTIVCKVLSYDRATMRAKVQPLVKRALASPNTIEGVEQQEPQILPIIVEVPVIIQGNDQWSLLVPPREGDIVVVAIAEHDIDAIMLGGQEGDLKTQRVHSLDDALIVGVLYPNNKAGEVGSLQTEPVEIFAGNHEQTIYIQLENNGKITIQTTQEVLIKAPTVKCYGSQVYLGDGCTGGEGVPFGNSLKSWLDAHVHEFTNAHGATSTTRPPTGASPAPSSVTYTV